MTRVLLNIEGLGPIALDVSYDHFDIRTTGVLTGLVVDAPRRRHGPQTVRRDHRPIGRSHPRRRRSVTDTGRLGANDRPPQPDDHLDG